MIPALLIRKFNGSSRWLSAKTLTEVRSAKSKNPTSMVLSGYCSFIDCAASWHFSTFLPATITLAPLAASTFAVS